MEKVSPKLFTAEGSAVQMAYAKHIKEVFADRNIVNAMENAAEQAMRTEGMDLPHVILIIDAMDKAKRLLPRQVENSKKFSKLWRPSLHVARVLAAGVLECFAVLEADQRGDSDCQQNILSRAIGLVQAELHLQGKDLPRRLLTNNDNTPKEGRNSMMLRWAAAMLSAALMTLAYAWSKLDIRTIVSTSGFHP